MRTKDEILDDPKAQSWAFWVGMLFMFGVAAFLFVQDTVETPMPQERNFAQECQELIKASGKPKDTACVLNDTEDNRIVVGFE